MAAKKKNERNWYLLVGGRESGPFDYEQVKEKISKGEVSSFDFVKALNQELWGTLLDNEIFNADAILAEIKSFDTIAGQTPNGKRKHRRSPILADVFVKIDGALIKGRALEVGKGGMGIEAGEGFGEPDSVVSIYCSPVSESMAFNCHAKIITKIKLSEGKYKYGVQFLKLSLKGETFLFNMLDAIEKIKEAS